MGSRIAKYIKYVIQCVLGIIYDDSGECIVCKSSLEEGYICDTCYSKINGKEIIHSIKREELILHCISIGYYSGVLKELVLGLKYKNDFRCGKIMSDLINNVIERNNLCFDFISYVPSSKKSLKKRGYNQAEYISTLIGEKRDKQVIHCIEKHRETKDQIGLSGNDRWINLKGSFKFSGKNHIEGASILLIDDVITTGATAFYCSKLLLNEGCGKVTILTVAKSTI